MKTTFNASVVAMLLAVAAAAAGEHITSSELRGEGAWKTDGEAPQVSQHWGLNLQRTKDGRVTGIITVTDSPLFAAGTVDGTFDGRIISGTIADEAGNHAATFSGAVSREGFSGKYTDRTGETGEWHWAGKLPE